jgi:ABC-type lipoprotein export system ATPase subunit
MLSNGFTVLLDPSESLSTAILSVLVGLDDIDSGDILIDGTPYETFFASRQLLSTFGYVFDEGIMLANLSLRENLLLPWRKRFEGIYESEWQRDVDYWLKRMSLGIDLNLRPAHISGAQRKFLGLIRSLMLKPQLLLIDDPYYLLNKRERAQMFRFLTSLKGEQEMLIASADDDFCGSIATDVLDFATYSDLFSLQ